MVLEVFIEHFGNDTNNASAILLPGLRVHDKHLRVAVREVATLPIPACPFAFDMWLDVLEPFARDIAERSRQVKQGAFLVHGHSGFSIRSCRDPLTCTE